MGQYFEIDGVRPVVHASAFVHPSAILIGDAIVGPRCYVAPGVVMRGNFGRLVLEEGSNLQDTCIMHGYAGYDTVVGVDGHIGHGAVLHGCKLGRNVLVGMNAVVMDGAIIGDDAFVAACAFVRAGFEVPPRTIAAGTPAKILRELTDEVIAWKHAGTVEYQELAERSIRTMRPTTPLAEMEPDRKRIEIEGTIHLFEAKRDKGVG
jgi:phenylacetic acid degradation protein